jgi:hypothetical protein
LAQNRHNAHGLVFGEPTPQAGENTRFAQLSASACAQLLQRFAPSKFGYYALPMSRRARRDNTDRRAQRFSFSLNIRQVPIADISRKRNQPC